MEKKYWAHLIAAAMVIVGLILVIAGQSAEGKFDWGKIGVSVGSAIIFIGVLHWLWDLFSKEALIDELKETILGSKRVAQSGVADFHNNSRDINFGEWIAQTRTLQTLFNYNSRFLLDYAAQIEEMLRKGGELELIFLERQSSTAKHMVRLGWEPTSMEAHYLKIENAVDAWQRQFGTKVRTFYVNALFKYSAVRMDNCLFLILNTCTNKRQVVPAIRIKPHTPLWGFVTDDMNKLVASE